MRRSGAADAFAEEGGGVGSCGARDVLRANTACSGLYHVNDMSNVSAWARQTGKGPKVRTLTFLLILITNELSNI